VKIVWSSEARQDLRAIRKFIGRDSEFYAARMVARIVERVEKTAEHPTRGHTVHEYPETPLKEVHESHIESSIVSWTTGWRLSRLCTSRTGSENEIG
jgi:plasmid stabilization system protein ParE